MASNVNAADDERGGRRTGDRRVAQLPIDFPDRRKGERRSGDDRRANKRLQVRKD